MISFLSQFTKETTMRRIASRHVRLTLWGCRYRSWCQSWIPPRSSTASSGLPLSRTESTAGWHPGCSETPGTWSVPIWAIYMWVWAHRRSQLRWSWGRSGTEAQHWPKSCSGWTPGHPGQFSWSLIWIHFHSGRWACGGSQTSRKHPSHKSRSWNAHYRWKNEFTRMKQKEDISWNLGKHSIISCTFFTLIYTSNYLF